MAKVRKVGVGLAEFWVKIFSGPSWFSSCLFQLEVAFYQEFEAAGPAFHWKVPRAFIWKHLKGTKHFKKHQWNEINQRKLRVWNLLICCNGSLSFAHFCFRLKTSLRRSFNIEFPTFNLWEKILPKRFEKLSKNCRNFSSAKLLSSVFWMFLILCQFFIKGKDLCYFEVAFFCENEVWFESKTAFWFKNLKFLTMIGYSCRLDLTELRFNS